MDDFVDQIFDTDTTSKQYYSQRHSRGPLARPISLDSLTKGIITTLRNFVVDDYFQFALGYECVDAGHVEGDIKVNVQEYFFTSTHRTGLWPENRDWKHVYTLDELCDLVEVSLDIVAKPIEGTYHTYDDCGWHYHTFNKEEGRNDLARHLNRYLDLLDAPLEINEEGQIVEKGSPALNPLLRAHLPDIGENKSVNERVHSAIEQFRARGSEITDRRKAVTELASVLEYLRPHVKENMLSEDEGALFNIANNFGLRHNSRTQRVDYDKPVWLSWAFYVYLSTIHAVTFIIKRQMEQEAA